MNDNLTLEDLASKKKNLEGRCLIFISKCNNLEIGSNDELIVKVIFRHLNSIHDLSIESISQESTISKAVVSRFFRKYGFDSFADFKYAFDKFFMGVQIRNDMKVIKQTPLEKYQRAQKNLEDTYSSLDIKKLEKISKMILNSKEVVFIGDNHELCTFYTLQLDLMVKNIPAFLYNVNEVTSQTIKSLPENSTIICLSVLYNWFGEEMDVICKLAKEKERNTILFSQDVKRQDKYVDILYSYGVENSNNDGYYSLQLLCNILGELLN